MFETSYLFAILGNPPYTMADEFGLTKEDILKYQQEWRKAGIEPTLVEL